MCTESRLAELHGKLKPVDASPKSDRESCAPSTSESVAAEDTDFASSHNGSPMSSSSRSRHPSNTGTESKSGPKESEIPSSSSCSPPFRHKLALKLSSFSLESKSNLAAPRSQHSEEKSRESNSEESSSQRSPTAGAASKSFVKTSNGPVRRGNNWSPEKAARIRMLSIKRKAEKRVKKARQYGTAVPRVGKAMDVSAMAPPPVRPEARLASTGKSLLFSYTPEYKLACIDYMRTNNYGPCETAKACGISEPSFREWRKNEAALRKKVEAPALRKDDKAPALREKVKAPALRNDDKAPASRKDDKAPPLRKKLKALPLRKEVNAPALRKKRRAPPPKPVDLSAMAPPPERPVTSHLSVSGKVTAFTYTPEYKVACIDYMRNNGYGALETAAACNIAQRSFYQWRKKEASLREEVKAREEEGPAPKGVDVSAMAPPPERPAQDEGGDSAAAKKQGPYTPEYKLACIDYMRNNGYRPFETVVACNISETSFVEWRKNEATLREQAKERAAKSVPKADYEKALTVIAAKSVDKSKPKRRIFTPEFKVACLDHYHQNKGTREQTAKACNVSKASFSKWVKQEAQLRALVAERARTGAQGAVPKRVRKKVVDLSKLPPPPVPGGSIPHGRKSGTYSTQFKVACMDYQRANKLTAKRAAQLCKVGETTYFAWLKQEASLRAELENPVSPPAHGLTGGKYARTYDDEYKLQAIDYYKQCGHTHVSQAAADCGVSRSALATWLASEADIRDRVARVNDKDYFRQRYLQRKLQEESIDVSKMEPPPVPAGGRPENKQYVMYRPDFKVACIDYMRRNDYTIPQVIHACEISEAAFYRWLRQEKELRAAVDVAADLAKEADADATQSFRMYSDAFRQKVVEWHNASSARNRLIDTAEHFKVSEGAVRRWLKEAAVPSSSKKAKKKQQRFFDNAFRVKVLDFYHIHKHEYTKYEIVSHFDLRRPTFNTWLKTEDKIRQDFEAEKARGLGAQDSENGARLSGSEAEVADEKEQKVDTEAEEKKKSDENKEPQAVEESATAANLDNDPKSPEHISIPLGDVKAIAKSLLASVERESEPNHAEEENKFVENEPSDSEARQQSPHHADTDAVAGAAEEESRQQMASDERMPAADARHSESDEDGECFVKPGKREVTESDLESSDIEIISVASDAASEDAASDADDSDFVADIDGEEAEDESDVGIGVSERSVDGDEPGTADSVAVGSTLPTSAERSRDFAGGHEETTAPEVRRAAVDVSASKDDESIADAERSAEVDDVAHVALDSDKKEESALGAEPEGTNAGARAVASENQDLTSAEDFEPPPVSRRTRRAGDPYESEFKIAVIEYQRRHNYTDAQILKLCEVSLSCLFRWKKSEQQLRAEIERIKSRDIAKFAASPEDQQIIALPFAELTPAQRTRRAHLRRLAECEAIDVSKMAPPPPMPVGAAARVRKSDGAKMFGPEYQLAVLEYMEEHGYSVHQVSKACGVHRTTIQYWRKRKTIIRERVEKIKREKLKRTKPPPKPTNSGIDYRKLYSREFKLQVLDWLVGNPSQKEAVKKFNVPLRSVRKWIADEDAIRKGYTPIPTLASHQSVARAQRISRSTSEYTRKEKLAVVDWYYANGQEQKLTAEMCRVSIPSVGRWILKEKEMRAAEEKDMPASKANKQHYTLQLKIAALDYFKANSQDRIKTCKTFKLKLTTFRRWIFDEKQIRAQFAHSKAAPKKGVPLMVEGEVEAVPPSSSDEHVAASLSEPVVRAASASEAPRPPQEEEAAASSAASDFPPRKEEVVASSVGVASSSASSKAPQHRPEEEDDNASVPSSAGAASSARASNVGPRVSRDVPTGDERDTAERSDNGETSPKENDVESSGNSQRSSSPDVSAIERMQTKRRATATAATTTDADSDDTDEQGFTFSRYSNDFKRQVVEWHKNHGACVVRSCYVLYLSMCFMQS